MLQLFPEQAELVQFLFFSELPVFIVFMGNLFKLSICKIGKS